MAVAPPVRETPLRMTFEEFLDWAIGKEHRVEWVDGEVRYMSPVTAPHADEVRFLLRLFSEYLDENPVGEVLSDYLQRTRLRRTGRVPDLLYVAKENIQRRTHSFLDGPADLAVEVVSDDSERRDAETKLAEYEAGGVLEYWWIDPRISKALFYQLGEDGKYRLVAPEPDGVYHCGVIRRFW